MKFKKPAPLVLAAAVAIGAGLAGTAFAGSSEHGENQAEKQAIGAASISLIDAIRIAEKRVDGKAEDSGIENQNGKTFFWDVQVRGADGKSQEVLVDMNSGEVIKVTLDNGDHENDDDHERGGHERGEHENGDCDEGHG